MRSLLYFFALLLLSAAVLSSCNQSQKTNETSKADASAIDSPITINNNGVNIAYTDTGKNDTTLLFIHGWAINKSY